MRAHILAALLLATAILCAFSDGAFPAKAFYGKALYGKALYGKALYGKALYGEAFSGEDPCSGSRPAIEAEMPSTFPYADHPPSDVRVEAMEPYGDGSSCLVSYTVDGVRAQRLYEFLDGVTSRISLPFASLRWCGDTRCRGHVQ